MEKGDGREGGRWKRKKGAAGERGLAAAGRWAGERVVADGQPGWWGLTNTVVPKDARIPFCLQFLFLSPTTPPDRATIPLRPLAFHQPLQPSAGAVHLKYEFDITFQTVRPRRSLSGHVPRTAEQSDHYRSPARFNYQHFIKSIDSPVLFTTSQINVPAGRELFRDFAFTNTEAAAGGKLDEKPLEINISTAASSRRTLTPRGKGRGYKSGSYD